MLRLQVNQVRGQLVLLRALSIVLGLKSGMLLGEMNNLRIELALLVLEQRDTIDYILILMLELMMCLSTLG